MENELMHYATLKIIDDIRREVVLPSKLIKEISSVPMIDLLRDQIVEEDIDHLKIYMMSKDNALIQFAIALFQNIKDSPQIKKELHLLWKNSITFDEKMNVMFRLLDYPDLSKEIHISIYDFTTQNWDRWIKECVKWQAADDINNVLDAMKTRLKDKRFPLNKAWVYLLMATASPDREGCHELINKYTNKEIPNFEKLLERINN